MMYTYANHITYLLRHGYNETLIYTAHMHTRYNQNIKDMCCEDVKKNIGSK